jgi:hypothetical protein
MKKPSPIEPNSSPHSSVDPFKNFTPVGLDGEILRLIVGIGTRLATPSP